jgi:hypothetical protein
MYKKDVHITVLYQLYIHYKLARDLCVLVFNLFGIEWIMPQRWRSCWLVGEVGLVATVV